MEEHTHLPEANQLSVLASTILLAYALTPFVKIPAIDFGVSLPFGVFSFSINFLTIVSILVAALAGVGSDWLLRSHPHLEARSTIPHILLPTMTAWVIGVPLSTLDFDVSWWVLYAMGGVLLVMVFIAEYIAVDFSDIRFAPAAIGLTALSFALFLILAITLRSAGWRLYLVLPGLAVPVFLVALRTIYLRSNGQWRLAWAVGITLVIVQIATGLQYLPVTPIGYGLFLVAPAYSLTSFAVLIEEGRPVRSAWPGPLIIMVLLVALGLVLSA
jgi:hypothetical protein